MNAQELKQISAAIYIVRGGEQYLLDSVLGKFKAIGADVGADIMSPPYFAQDIVQRANTVSFFAEKSVVIVENCKKLTDDEKKILETYAASPNTASVLVFVVVEESAEKAEDFKFLEKYAEVVRCDTLSGNNLMDWVADVVESFDRKIKTDAMRQLIANCANDMAVIYNELQKLFDYSQGEITASDVKASVCKSTEIEVFELSKALAIKNNTKAFVALGALLEKGDEPVALYGLLQSHFRRVLHCKLSNLSVAELAKLFKVKPMAIEILKKTIDNYTVKEAKYICDLLNENEYKFKSGVFTPEQALLNAVAMVLAKNSAQ